jgi:hypothetical protein
MVTHVTIMMVIHNSLHLSHVNSIRVDSCRIHFMLTQAIIMLPRLKYYSCHSMPIGTKNPNLGFVLRL